MSGRIDIKYRHSFLIDELKVYLEILNMLKKVNEIILPVSCQNRAYYGVVKCAEIVFKSRKILKSKGLQALQEKMKTMDPYHKEILKLFLHKQADGEKIKEMCNRVKEEVTKRMKTITKTKLIYKNLIRRIKTKLCNFSQLELVELDQV